MKDKSSHWQQDALQNFHILLITLLKLTKGHSMNEMVVAERDLHKKLILESDGVSQ